MKIAINFNYGEYRKIQLQTLKKLKYLFWSNLREELTRWRKKIYERINFNLEITQLIA